MIDTDQKIDVGEWIWNVSTKVARFFAFTLAIIVISLASGSLAAYLVLQKHSGTTVATHVKGEDKSLEDMRALHQLEIAELQQQVHELTVRMTDTSRKAKVIADRVSNTDQQLAVVHRTPTPKLSESELTEKAKFLLNLNGKVVSR